MRYAVLRTANWGITHSYEYGELSHVTAKCIMTKAPVGYKNRHDKGALVCYTETEDLAQQICAAFKTHKESYEASCKKAADLYKHGVEIIIAEARDRADTETAVVEEAMAKPAPPARPREFKPRVIDGGRG